LLSSYEAQEILKTQQRHLIGGSEFVFIESHAYPVSYLEKIVGYPVIHKDQAKVRQPKTKGGKLTALMNELGREPKLSSKFEQAMLRMKKKREGYRPRVQP
jgi:hypothetical protein